MLTTKHHSFVSNYRKTLTVMALANDVMALISQIDDPVYKKSRKDINDAFFVGDFGQFNGNVEEDAEIGDL
ncbi:MAG: hypothetical protein ACI936_000050 [Paraglaciecola sp.]|jgi:hypothetical protein